MRRFIPEARALYERVRRPAIPFVIALALMAPAAGIVMSGAGWPVQTVEAPAAAERAADARTAAKSDAGRTVADAWRERALEREREDAAARFAREYRVSPSLAQLIHDAAVQADIEPRVAFGLVQAESSFRRTVVSSAGAVGYTQVLPSTARWMEPGTARSELFHTRTNLRLGFTYLRYLIDKYDGDMRLALTAYNRGPGTVDRVLKRGRNPENGYADKVLRRPPYRG